MADTGFFDSGQFGGNSVLTRLDDDAEIPAYQPDVAKVVIALIICVLGLIGNLVAIFVIIVLKEYQKSVTHWYVLQLAIADSVFLLTLPFQVSEDLNGQWIYPEWMCKGKETILFLNYYASILFLMIMSFDRFVAVCHPFSDKLQKLRKKFNAFIIAIVIWGISFIPCTPVILFSFKVGLAPTCKCSYEFPSYESRTSQCIQEGFTSPDAIKTCLGFYNVEIENGEVYCVKNAIPAEGDFGLGDLLSRNNGSLESLLGGDFPLAFLPPDDSQQTTQLVQDITESPDDDGTVHGACRYWDRPTGWTVFLCFNFTVMFIFPLIVMVLCYSLIVRRLSATQIRNTHVSSSTGGFTTATNGSNMKKKRKSSSRNDKDRRRVTIMCATLVSSFVICWLPFHAVHLAKIVGIPNTAPYVCDGWLAAGSLLAYLNSALNPYLYSFLGTNFARRWSSATGTVWKSLGRRELSSATSSSGREKRDGNRDTGAKIIESQRNKHNYKLSNADAKLPLDGSRATTQEFYFSDEQAYFFEKDLPQQI